MLKCVCDNKNAYINHFSKNARDTRKYSIFKTVKRIISVCRILLYNEINKIYPRVTGSKVFQFNSLFSDIF